MEGDGLCSRDDATGQKTSTEGGQTIYENGFGNVKERRALAGPKEY